jgi:hypothetical protein
LDVILFTVNLWFIIQLFVTLNNFRSWTFLTDIYTKYRTIASLTMFASKSKPGNLRLHITPGWKGHVAIAAR